jgi:hypothetical protein
MKHKQKVCMARSTQRKPPYRGSGSSHEPGASQYCRSASQGDDGPVRRDLSLPEATT